MSKQSAEEKVLAFLKLNAEPLPDGNLYICIGHKDICNGSGVCRRATFYAIKHLVKDGLLIKHGDVGGNKSPLINCYEIVI